MKAHPFEGRDLRAIVLAGAMLCSIGAATGAPAGSAKDYGSGGYGRKTYNAPVSAVPPTRRTTPAPPSPSSVTPWSSSAGAAPPVTYSGLAATKRTKQVSQAPGSVKASRDRARNELAASGPRPTPALQGLLDERQQSSGPGFFTGAFVAWLLMRGGHSAEDRHWLESKLAALRANGLDDDAPARLGLTPARSFRIDRAAAMTVGQPQRLEIHWSGQEAPIRCTVDGQVATGKTPLAIDWTPPRAGAFMVDCEAGKQRQRAMLQTRST